MEINWSTIVKESAPVVIYSVIILLISIILLRIVKKVDKAYREKNGPTLHMQLLVNIVKAAIWILCITGIASQFKGFSTTISTLLASSGILALGISMAAQESLTNLIDGIFLSVYKPFNIGDRITLPEKNITGTVTEMNLRHTIITTFNNTRYIISNSAISNAIIENSSENDTYTSFIDISITYDSDIDKAKQIMANIISNHPDFIDKRTEEQKADNVPVISVSFRAFGDSGIELRAPLVTKNVSTAFTASSQIRYEIKKEFDKQGVKFPFTTITISQD